MNTYKTIRSAFLFVLLASVTLYAVPAFAQSGNRGAAGSGNAAAGSGRSSVRSQLTSQPATSRNQQLRQVADQNQSTIGLEGYCPVCVVGHQEWVKGDPSHNATFDGVTYFFPDNAVKETFLQSPAKYVPVLRGDCIVCLDKKQERIAGNVRAASLYKQRLYLFPSSAEKKMFDTAAAQFVNSDLALDGACIVCQVKKNQAVKGSSQFTHIYNGLRYQFPSASEMQEFARSPGQYVNAVAVAAGSESKGNGTTATGSASKSAGSGTAGSSAKSTGSGSSGSAKKTTDHGTTGGSGAKPSSGSKAGSGSR